LDRPAGQHRHYRWESLDRRTARATAAGSLRRVFLFERIEFMKDSSAPRRCNGGAHRAVDRAAYADLGYAIVRVRSSVASGRLLLAHA